MVALLIKCSKGYKGIGDRQCMQCVEQGELRLTSGKTSVVNSCYFNVANEDYQN